ncbi:neutral/alkaline ceramidase [Deinococcus aquaedulcis]|uniref:neutral/alkaline ceramidase n=1 Tax=Deinococcus aquaedulcis TaxID=2840455 RepID=UPI001C83DC30|nr:neutral/alkaline ceramidase [Deinococcus aquaedulcis]
MKLFPVPHHRPATRLTLALLTGALLTACGAPPPAAPLLQAQGDGYTVGAGFADITGEAAEMGMFGYAQTGQRATGIHQRQRARAFVIADGASGSRALLVVADLGIITQAVHTRVLEELRARYGNIYTEDNVLLTATHTHSGPGGFSHYALYNITILGFQARTFEATVAGIVRAAERAHASAAPAEVRLGRTTLQNASVNRSLSAFLRNPAADRAAFPGAIDPAVTTLRFGRGGQDFAALTFFATHGTSLTNANTLISGDNKGYAAYAWERLREGVNYRSGRGFVAAFAQTNAGDMSPNLNLRPGSGPTEDPLENVRQIGQRQLDAALRAPLDTPLRGRIDARLEYVDFSRLTVTPEFTGGPARTTCPAALGTSFAAGSTEDGPGISWIQEGERNPLFAALGSTLFQVSPELRACQAPKEILIANGTTRPYPWSPEVLPVQLVKVGQLHLIALPAELTVNSGLRLRRTVAARLGVPLDDVLAVGYANAYAGYVTTPEEYDEQAYEGASTHFGRWTLPAFQQETARMADLLRRGEPAGRTVRPRDLRGEQLNFQTGVVQDGVPLGRRFGDVLRDASAAYRPGETVQVEFYTGHPKNNLRSEQTFLEVQRQTAPGTWTTVADDGDWATTYRWERLVFDQSRAVIRWTIPAGTPGGTYRIVHHGDWKAPLVGWIRPFSGTSRAFQVSD